MGLLRLCKGVVRACKRRSKRKPRRLRKPRPKHQADAPPRDGSCLLLSLPAEIRLRILEHTLCYKDPIQARENIRAVKAGDASYSLFQSSFDEWPQGKPYLDILRSCRQLHDEGVEVFYKRNTFGVTIYDPGWGGGYSEVDFLGLGDIRQAFHRFSRFKDCFNIKLTFVLADAVQCTTLGINAYKDAIDQPIQQLRTWWKGCGRLDIEVIQRNAYFTQYPLGPAFLFHKLGTLRCKGVWFRGLLPYSLTSILTELIESDRRVLDLQLAFRELSQFLEGVYFRDNPPISAQSEALSAAEKAAAEYDEVEFMRIRKEIIDDATARIISGTESWMERGNELKNGVIPIHTAGDFDTDSITIMLNQFL